MSERREEGTLMIENIDSSNGKAVRVAFMPKGASEILFSCWVPEDRLLASGYGDPSVRPTDVSSVLIAYTRFKYLMGAGVSITRKRKTFGL